MFHSTQIRYLVREGFMGLLRRRISGSVAVIIMGSSLLMLALFSLVTINLDRILQSVRGEIDVAVYLDEGVHEQDQALLQKDLMATEGVRSVVYVGRDQALRRFRAELGDDAELLDALQENPLPASFELRLEPTVMGAERLDDLTRTVEAYPGVTDKGRGWGELRVHPEDLEAAQNLIADWLESDAVDLEAQALSAEESDVGRPEPTRPTRAVTRPRPSPGC